MLGRQVSSGLERRLRQTAALAEHAVRLGQHVQSLLRRDAREEADVNGAARGAPRGSMSRVVMPSGTTWIRLGAISR